MRRRKHPRRTRTILAISAALFLVLFFPSYPIQWLGYLIIVTVLASYAYSRSMAANLEIRRDRSRLLTYRGQPARVELAIRNRGYLRMPYISVVDTTGGLFSADRERTVVTVRPGETVRLSYTVKGVNRGAYRLGPIRVRLSDPLGLYPRQMEIRELAEAVIYPQVYAVRLLDDRGLPAGNARLANPVYEDATRYRSVREYVPGDDPRKISWKVSARMGRLHSLDFLPTMYFPTVVLLNLTASDYQRRHRFHHTERAIEAAASLVYYAIGRGQSVGLVSTGVLRGSADHAILPMRSGVEYGTEILGALARISPNDAQDDALALLFERAPVPFGTRVQYVGPRLRDDQVEYLARKTHGGITVELFNLREQVLETDVERTSDAALFRRYAIREYGEPIIAREP